MRASAAMGTLTVVLALAVPGAAQAVTFGADLNALPANNAPGTTCADAPPGFPIIGPFGSASCMWSVIDTATTGSASLTAPQSGVVNAIRVKVGATTGPMRVNVVRFLFRQTGDPAHPFSAGPFLEAYGPDFTPQANAVTTVPANLSMKEDPTPLLTDTQTIQVIDALALEVRAPNVPFPYFTRPTALTYLAYPGPTGAGRPAPDPQPLGSALGAGYGVLLSADLTPDAPAPTPTPTPTPTPAGGGGTVLPTLTLPRTTARVRDGRATVPITCQGADCAGLLQLLRRGAGAAATPKRVVSYGSARFSAKAGATANVKVKLSRAGRALLKQHRSAKVTLKVTFSSGGGKPAAYALTLRR